MKNDLTMFHQFAVDLRVAGKMPNLPALWFCGEMGFQWIRHSAVDAAFASGIFIA